MNIEKRIKDLSSNELDRLLSSLSFLLSGSEIGQAEAFTLMAEIEAIGIKESKKRMGKSGSNPLGGLSDEQQAGYIG